MLYGQSNVTSTNTRSKATLETAITLGIGINKINLSSNKRAHQSATKVISKTRHPTTIRRNQSTNGRTTDRNRSLIRIVLVDSMIGYHPRRRRNCEAKGSAFCAKKLITIPETVPSV